MEGYNAEQNKKSGSCLSREIPIALAISLFLIGGELLTVGKESASDAYSSAVAFLVAILFLGAASPAARMIFCVPDIRRTESVAHRISLVVFGIFAVAASVYVALDTARDFSEFAVNVMLLRAPRLPVSLLFLGFCTYLASRGAETVKKYAFLSAVGVGACAVLLILLSLPVLDLDNFRFGGGTPDVERSVGAFVSKFAPICVALVFFGCEWGASGTQRAARLSPRAAVIGLLVGGAILTVCHFNVALLLGGALAREQTYPYSVAVSAVSTGKLFMRTEGLSYVMYFLSMTTRAALAIGTVIAVLKKLLPLKIH